MVTIFPDLLSFSFLAPTLLRLVIGLTFIYIGYTQFIRRDAIKDQVVLPWYGRPNNTLVGIAALFSVVIGVALVVGYATQLAALLGIGIALKQMIYAKKFPIAIPLCRLDYFYLVVILFTLMLTGAGAFAMDVRL